MRTDETIEQAVDVAEILDRMRHSESPHYPAGAVADARRYREQIIPALIECLETNVALAADGECDGDSPALISLCLLIEFNVSQAWPVVKQMALLPDDQPFDVVGDGIHEILPTAVALWGTGDLEQLANWCLDTNVNEYCRSALAKGVFEAYGRGLLARKTVLEFGKQLLEQAVREDYEFRAFLICDLLNLHGDELAEVIHGVFQRDLVEEGIVSEDCVESDFSTSKEATLQKYRASFTPLDRFTDQLQSWGGFQPRQEYDLEAELPFELEYDPPPVPSENPIAEPIKPPARIRRNDPCPCGSGKKFKKCCINT